MDHPAPTAMRRTTKARRSGMRLSSRKIAILTAREVTRSRSRRASYCRCATIPRARTPLIGGGARMQALRRTVLVDDKKDRASRSHVVASVSPLVSASLSAPFSTRHRSLPCSDPSHPNCCMLAPVMALTLARVLLRLLRARAFSALAFVLRTTRRSVR